MRWAAAIFALTLSITACTERVLLKESSESIHEEDARSSPPPHSALDAGDGSHRDCKLNDELKWFSRSSAEVMILLDRSTAMHQAFGASTKLATVQASLRDAVTAYQSSIKFGFIEYPGPSGLTDCGSGTCCANRVLVKPGLNNLRDLVRWMSCESSSYPCPDQTADTPLHLGLASIKNINSGSSFDNRRNQWDSWNYSQSIFLFSAADAGCTGKRDVTVCDDALIHTRALADMGIQIITFAIGWNPPADSCIVKISKETLSSSFKKLVPITTESDLTTPLETILTTLSKESCKITLDGWVNRPNKLVVTFDGVPIKPDRINGWELKDNSRWPHIQFYGQACDTLRTGNVGQIKVIDKCSTCAGPDFCR